MIENREQQRVEMFKLFLSTSISIEKATISTNILTSCFRQQKSLS